MRRRPTTPDDIRGRQSEECEGEEEDEEGQREQGEEEEKERRLLCSLDRRRLSEALRTTAGRTDARRASATATAEEAVAREERERACGAARWWMRLPSSASVPSRSAQADALPQFGAGATVVG